MWLGPCLLASVLATPSPAPSADLPGNWTLDEEKSDDARDKMRQGSGDRPSGGGGGRGGFGGGGGRMGGGMRGGGGMGGGRGAQDSQVDRTAVRSLMESLLNPPRGLLVEVTPSEVTITPEDGTALHLHPDGKKVKAEDGTSLERKTKWEGANLVTETQVGTGFSLKETYAVTPEGILHVTDHLERRWGQAVDIHRVYERGPAPEPSPLVVVPAPEPSPVQAVESRP